MGGHEALTVGEFERGLRRLEARFDSVDDKLSDHGERIAVLEASKVQTAKKATAWGSAVAGLVMLVVEGLKALKG